ncbi:MAG: DUF86 domain-containing protein [Rubrivivax sp.]|nr:DUF86 domain-containing protein [Rubrivivax sp.]
MKRDRSAFLWDMQQGCAAILGFIVDATPERYEQDLLLRSAVERQLQNVGEALSQLARLDADLAGRVPRHRQLIAFRNVLVHGYAALNHGEVWRVLHENLPELHAAVSGLLDQVQSQRGSSE